MVSRCLTFWGHAGGQRIEQAVDVSPDATAISRNTGGVD